MNSPQVPIVSKDKTKLDPLFIQSMLHETYWGKSRTVTEIQTTIENSRCYGLYLNGQQIGFARVLSDTVVFAYLMDVLIHKDYKGKGYSKILLDFIFNDPEYAKIHRWNLATRDAHGLYEKYGFSRPTQPEVFMEKTLVKWS
ncbi:MAG: GNAT family N-acetyltransferase [Crocinitomicaceae bacterium]|jgi:GNAT superfamily N-acetyltransferase|nr:GNAT family N-acetyltransferase [Crocinitomicaceae bacterium]